MNIRVKIKINYIEKIDENDNKKNKFICNNCNKKLASNYSLNRHKKICKNVKKEEENVNQFEENEKINFKCTKCSKKYKTEKYLLEHEKKCMGINILTCPKCMKSFSSRFSKSNHIKKNNICK